MVQWEITYEQLIYVFESIHDFLTLIRYVLSVMTAQAYFIINAPREFRVDFIVFSLFLLPLLH